MDGARVSHLFFLFGAAACFWAQGLKRHSVSNHIGFSQGSHSSRPPAPGPSICQIQLPIACPCPFHAQFAKRTSQYCAPPFEPFEAASVRDIKDMSCFFVGRMGGSLRSVFVARSREGSSVFCIHLARCLSYVSLTPAAALQCFLPLYVSEDKTHGGIPKGEDKNKVKMWLDAFMAMCGDSWPAHIVLDRGCTFVKEVGPMGLRPHKLMVEQGCVSRSQLRIAVLMHAASAQL